jgi:hypothetical protein
MKCQYSTSTMMLLTAFIAILSPLWVPLMFGSYAIGRRGVTPKLVALFAAIEGTIVAAFYMWKS